MSGSNVHKQASIRLFTIFIVIVLVTILAFFSNTSLAHADGSLCQLGSSDPCKEVFAVGSGNQPLNLIIKGPGQTYIESILKAYVVSTGTQEADTYMLFRMTVTLNPDFNSSLGNWLIPSFDGYPDSSTTGAKSTLQARLWSTHTQVDCAVGIACTQSNYSELEVPSYCYANGGSQNFGVNGVPLGGGANVGWSIASPTYSWCTIATPSDPYSRYYDYTLQDANQANAQITEDFVFAQWQQSSNHTFNISYSASSHLGQLVRSTRTETDGPSIVNQSATYQV